MYLTIPGFLFNTCVYTGTVYMYEVVNQALATQSHPHPPDHGLGHFLYLSRLGATFRGWVRVKDDLSKWMFPEL